MKPTFLTIVMLALVVSAGHAKQENSNQMLPSYWSDSKGNWTIAFLEKGAIYESKLWVYKQRNMNLDTGEAEMIITDGEEDLKIVVGKDKKGKRTMKIGKQKMTCSMISNQFASEFPAKDAHNNFYNENNRH